MTRARGRLRGRRRAARAPLRRDRGRRRVRSRARAGDALPDARLAVAAPTACGTSPRGTASCSRTAARPGSTAASAARSSTSRSSGRWRSPHGGSASTRPSSRRRNLVRRRRVPLPHALGRPLRLGRLRGLPRRRARARPLRRAAGRAGASARGQGRSSASGSPASSSRRSRTWATSRSRRRAERARGGAAEVGQRRGRDGQHLAARRHHRPDRRRRRRDRATGRSARRSSADALGLRPEDVDVADRARHVDERLDGRLGQLLVALLGRRDAAQSTSRRRSSPRSCGRSRRPSSAARRRRSSCATGKAWRGERVGLAPPARRHRALAPGVAAGRARAGPARDGVLRAPEPRAARTRTTASPRRPRTASSSTSPSSRSTRETGAVAVLDYATVHDAGRLLNPLLADGQVRGGFAHGVGGGALRARRLRRGRQPAHGHVHGLPLPDRARPAAAPDRPPRDAVAVHPARREGARRRNTMSAPVAIANAVADALGRRRRRAAADPGAASGSCCREAGAVRVRPARRAVEEALAALASTATTRSCSPAARASSRCSTCGWPGRRSSST